MTTVARGRPHLVLQGPVGDLVAGGEPLEPEYDVVTEIWYDDLAAFTDEQRDARQRPELVAAVIADEKVLFDRARTRAAFAEDRVSDLTTVEVAEWSG
ncbi:EthD domain-containing protein [Frankia nepalensis]|uniref:EthD domain-containing protein n=1 Tax=Frankia nepalensis TaxID=1836974 RepID=UPI0027DDA6A1|nr:EthD domain-containing protein [Frankia nepalensis]